MAVMDEFKEERAKVKEMTFLQKLDHFVYYHKVGIMMTILIGVIAFVGIYDAVSSKDVAMYIALIDCVQNNYANTTTDKTYETSIAKQLGINADTHMVTLDTSFVISSIQNAADESAYELPEVLYTRLATGQLAAFMAQESTINGWVMNDGFLDLREVLTEEQYEYYKDSFYWIDYDFVVNYEYTFDEGAYVYNEDHRSPEGMVDPMPVGIYLTPNEEFQDNYTFLFSEEIVYCFTINTYDEEKDEYNGTQLAAQYLDILSGRAAELAETTE